MMDKPAKQKIIVLLALAVLPFLSLVCSLTTGRPSNGNLLAENSTHPQQRTTTTVTTNAIIMATPTRSVCLITAENLNLRTGPGVQYAVQASLTGGTVLFSLPCPILDGWLLVRTGSQTGYVNSKFTTCERK